jgi:hypothetical protein
LVTALDTPQELLDPRTRSDGRIGQELEQGRPFHANPAADRCLEGETILPEGLGDLG